MKMTKILALALSALVLTSGLAGCKKDDDAENNSDVQQNDAATPGTDDKENEVQIPESGISAYEWKYADDEVMFTINGKDYDFATYRYYAMNMKSNYDNGDENYWNEETEASFKEDMIEQFKWVASLRILCEEKGIQITEQDFAGIDEYIEQLKTIYGEEGYRQQLDAAYLTDDVYRNESKSSLYVENLYVNAANEEKIIEYADKNYVHVKHVLVSTLDENDKALTGAALEEKTTLANDIAQRAKNGEDFDALVKEYGEDPGMKATPEGYTFTYGKMVPEFEEMSFQLSEGEVSEPVKTSYGYHIIKKYPIDFEALISEKGEEYWDIVYAVGGPIAQTEIFAKAETLNITLTEAFETLTLSNIGIKK